MGPIGFDAGSIESRITVDRTPFQQGLDEAKAEARRFADDKYEAKLGVAGDTETKAKIDDVRASAERLATAASTIRVDADTAPASTKFTALRADDARLASSAATITVDADTAPATVKLTAVQADVSSLAGAASTVTVDADTAPILAKIAKVQADLAQLQREKTNPTIDLDIAAAEVKRQRLVDALDALQAKKADPKIDLDIAAAELKRIDLVAKLDVLQAKPWTATAELDEGKILLQIAQVQARLDALAAKKTTLLIDTDEAEFLVKIAKAQADIDKLTVKKATVTIDADIGAAEAQLAALQAQLAATGSATEGAASQFNAMFAGITAAFPPASTAVLSLSGALALAVVPMAAISVGMGGIAAAAAPLAGEFLNLQSVVSATFEQGMKPAIVDVSALMPTLQAGLVGTAGALSTVAQQVGAVVASQNGLANLQAIFSNVQTIVAGMAPGISGLVQNFLDLASLGTSSLGGLSTIINGLSTQWHELIVNLTASGQAQGAMSSLTGALGAVLAVLPPLVAQGVQLMDVLGPPLVGALQLVGGALNLLSGPLGGITSTVLVGLAAWKLLSLGIAGVTTAVAAVGGAWGTASVALGIGATATAENAVATQAATAALGEEAVVATAAAAGLGRVTAAAGFAAAAQGRLATTSVGAAAATTATGAAASGAAAGASRFAGIIGGLSSAMLGIGVAAVVGYTAVKAFTTSTDDATKALGQGGQAAADMNAKIVSQTSVSEDANSAIGNWAAGVNNWISSQVFGIATTDSVTEAYNKQREAMTPLQLAQADATIAQGDLTKAQHDFLPGSQQVTDAQKAFAAATLTVTQAQAAALVSQTNIDASMQSAAAHFGDAAQAADGAAQSTVSYANALASLADPMGSAGDKTKAFAADVQGASDAPRTLLEAMNAADKSVTSFAESTIKIRPAMIDASGAIDTTSKAGQELATGIIGTAKAFDNLKGATVASSQAAGDDLVTSLAKGDLAMQKMRQNLIDTAVQHGATREAAQKMVDTYMAIPPSVKTDIQQPGMVAALADAVGLKSKITSIPDSKTIVVSSITDPVRKQLEDLGLTVKQLPNGQFIISANTDPALLKIAEARADAEKKQGIIPIDGDPAKFQAKLRDGIGVALTTTATMKLDANDAPAGLKRDLWKQDTNATNAIAKMDADTKPASIKRDLWKAETQASPPPVITVDANTMPAGMKRDVWKQETNSTTAIASVDANTLPAGMKRDLWKGETQLTTATANMDANPAQAVAKRDLWKGETERTTGVANLNANPAQAEGERVQWKHVADSTIAVMRANADVSNAQAEVNSFITMNNGRQINIIVTTTGSGGVASAGRLAEGGILRPMATGGIIANDSGNMLTPLQGGIAATVAPNTWRVIGDNMHVPESYIPQDGSPRSKAILGQTAADMGFGLVPKGLMEALKASGAGGTDGAAAAPPPQMAARPAQGMGDVAAAVAKVAARLEALERSDSNALVAAKLDQVVAQLRQGGAGAQIVVNDQSGNPVETARSTMLQLRMRR